MGSSLSLFGMIRVGDTLSVLDFLHLGSSLSLRCFSRVASSLSIFAAARMGSSMSVLDYLHCGGQMSVRSLVKLGSTVSISGQGTSDVPMVLYQPFTVSQTVACGSTLSVFGISRVGQSLSVLDCVNLGSSLSLRGSARLGSAVSQLEFLKLGASLALRCLARLASSMSVFGCTRFGSTVAILDKVWLTPDKIVKFPGWSMAWDAVNSKFNFHADGVTKPPLVISPTGGELHGTWTAESIISASDRRLKREILPLANSLPQALNDARTRETPTASRLLQALNPVRWHGSDLEVRLESHKAQDSKILFQADEVEKVFPHLIRQGSGVTPTSEANVGKGVLYQDFVALLMLAAQERQRRLIQHEAEENEENLRIQQQEELIDVLEKQVRSLRKRFARLRSLHPTPPSQTL